jgi:hypothetical protein
MRNRIIPYKVHLFNAKINKLHWNYYKLPIKMLILLFPLLIGVKNLPYQSITPEMALKEEQLRKN